ncbi:MAG TPA: HAMP domain-containing sensor histidine kinase [Candidatus Saccharimonadales bacterium]|nr:HAMP domain-containing sensor histidine kinase [Candidatus Saccharimonadales bacterium]
MYSMFRSARLKLTLFYLAILFGLSLALTISFRVLAEYEYAQNSRAQYGLVQRLLLRYPWDTTDPDFPSIKPEVAFGSIQDQQHEKVREQLNQDLMLINMLALLVGGMLSYWFAGRTLRPIEEAHEAQTRFAADASHELRTPLASMKVENEVFLRQKEFTHDEAREQIQSNLEEVQRLEQLANNLLALAQYDQVALDSQPESAKQIVEEAINQVAVKIKERNASMKIDVVDRNIRAHRNSFVQLLTILLDNALKYGPQSGEVKITGQKQGNSYIFRITDQGPGIAAEDLPHIFERLYRGDKARSTKTGGYGLGLALARQIAEANNADIVATNAKKGGACFEIRAELTK